MDSNKGVECFICKKIFKDRNMLSDHFQEHLIATSNQASRQNQNQNRSPPRTVDLFPDPLQLMLSPTPQTAPQSLAPVPKPNQPMKHEDPIANEEENEVSTALSLSEPFN
ncbi:hypothetical protein LXL04_036854 [Taraxacum kok-saghyz]